MKYICKKSNDRLLHVIFEEQVKKNPDSIALVYENTQLTYRELNERANQLAHHLIKTYTPRPDTFITLCLERSEVMIIAILAILKTGAAYVPIDPQYPKERIQFIIEDTDATLMITNGWYRDRLSVLAQEQKTNPVSDATNQNLAYVIYTSGTTGKPKGVMIEHQSVTNNAVDALSEIYDFANGNKVTTFASYAFDSSIPEIFCTLLKGGELHVLSQEVRLDAFKISRYIEANHINYLYLPPVLLALLPKKTYPCLKGVIYAGEPCDVNTALFWAQHVTLYNCYGPTETTVNATYKKIDNANVKLIGKPIANVNCYILDETMQQVPTGTIGELYIGGIGVARGYLNRPDLTAEKFIVNPFQQGHTQINRKDRLYKTGDLVRKLESGDLEYIGRTDFQVKIRGYRIELGEIENALNTYSQGDIVISQSIVIARKHLIAYYVTPIKLNEDDLLEYLQNKLPEFMIPAFFVHVEKLPVTINGKVDRDALPAPELTHKNNDGELLSEIENKIRHLFAEILDIPQASIGRYTDFFRLGGNSILAIELATKINDYYHSQLSVSDVFVEKNVASIAKIIPKTCSQWKNIICFNYSPHNRNLFMIHPGMGGCEVYTPIVEKLSTSFNCYGVDAYNFYHEDKIESLTRLAQYYLASIQTIMSETHQETFHLLGWSLGGKIALEIAALLEQQGIHNITLYLLDTLLYGDVREDAEEFKNYLLTKGADVTYVEKSLSLLDIANKLHECQLSSNLNHTKILLFKALMPSGEKPSDHEIFRKKLLLRYNHIEKCLKSKRQIKVVPLREKHSDLLNQSEILMSEILNFNANQTI